jgi:cytochrome P450
MALDAVRTAVLNALAVLTIDPAAHERALAEVRAADAAHGAGTVAGLADLAFVRACMLDSVRLWPAAAVLVRVTSGETEWYGEMLPAGARVLIPVVAQHRARRLPQANRFDPDQWLDGSADADWQMNVFSRGGAQCAGRNLALVLGTASLAELLRQRTYELLAPKLSAEKPLPYGINPLKVRLAVRPAG